MLTHKLSNSSSSSCHVQNFDVFSPVHVWKELANCFGRKSWSPVPLVVEVLEPISTPVCDTESWLYRLLMVYHNVFKVYNSLHHKQVTTDCTLRVHLQLATDRYTRRHSLMLFHRRELIYYRCSLFATGTSLPNCFNCQ